MRIDAIVVDARGRVVDTLKAGDFEVREDGAVRTLEAAEFTRADAPRLFAIYLDEYHISNTPAVARVREALTRFIDATLRPQDLVVVMKPLDSLLAIRLSGDRDAARRAIAGLEGRKGDYEPRNAYERNYIAGTPARIEAARAQVSLSALNALAVHLGSLGDGRKTLIVVTEGVGGGPERRRGQESLPTLDAVVRTANRATVSIYPVDPRESGDEGRESLRALASRTDGAIIDGDLAAGFDRLAADASAYYVLTYRAAHVEDGGYHAVEVRAKRAGVRVRARGYWAPSPDDVLRAAMLERIRNPPPPPPVEPPRHMSPLIRQWIGAARAEGGRTRVTLVWEPTGRVPGDRGRRDPSRVVLTASAGDGTVVFEGALSPTGPAVVDEPGATRPRAVFDAAPGRLRLRMSIQDAASRVLDSDVRDVAVPDLRRDVAIGTPEVLRARNAREFRLLDGDAAVPVAAREFSRAERLLIRFPAYAPTGAPLAISAKLLTRMGQTIRELRVTAAPAPSALNTLDLPLAGFAAGEYIIELTAASAAGEAKERIAFRVVS